jgi:IS5 family transposase
VNFAKRRGLKLRQSFEKEGRRLRQRASGYAHARQCKRLRRVLKRQRTLLGRVIRDIQRQLPTLEAGIQQSLRVWLERAQRLRNQRPKDKDKLYAFHAPEVECISKGKARQRYEFGVKISLVTTEQGHLIVGARRFPGNPYDGHTLAEPLEQTRILLQNVVGTPTTVIVDLGYRGVEIPGVDIVHRGKAKQLTTQQRLWLKRRQAIEPVIGQVKSDCGMHRCWMKGALGDALHAVLCAAGYNLRWLLRAVAHRGLKALLFALWHSLARPLRIRHIPVDGQVLLATA